MIDRVSLTKELLKGDFIVSKIPNKASCVLTPSSKLIRARRVEIDRKVKIKMAR